MLKIRYWWRMSIIVLQFQFMGSEMERRQSSDNRKSSGFYESLDIAYKKRKRKNQKGLRHDLS